MKNLERFGYAKIVYTVLNRASFLFLHGSIYSLNIDTLWHMRKTSKTNYWIKLIIHEELWTNAYSKLSANVDTVVPAVVVVTGVSDGDVVVDVIVEMAARCQMDIKVNNSLIQ